MYRYTRYTIHDNDNFVLTSHYSATNIVISVFTFYTWLKFTITSTKLYTVYVQGRRQDFGSKGGNIGQKFINDFRSSPVLQLRRKNFGSGGRTFSKNVLIKDFWKFLKNL